MRDARTNCTSGFVQIEPTIQVLDSYSLIYDSIETRLASSSPSPITFPMNWGAFGNPAATCTTFAAPINLNFSVKRPRSTARTVPLCSIEENRQNHRKSLTEKVEERLLEDEQAPPAPKPSVPRPLPLQNDLLNYRARNLARQKASRPTAADMYLRVLRNDRSDGRAWIGLARLRARDGRNEAAREAFAEGARCCVGNAYVLQAWGVFEQRIGNTRRALELFQSAVATDPKHCASWVALGLWYQRFARNYTRASECFGRGAEADSKNYYLWHVWGVLERERRNYAAARRCFKNGIEANPRNGATYVAYGALEASLGRLENAEKLYMKAHKVAPRNAHAFVSHANVAERLGRRGHARVLLERARGLRSNDPAPLQALALLEYRAGDLKAARSCFSEAVQLNEKHAPTYLSWGCMERDLKNYSRARELFQQAVWASPGEQAVRAWHAWASFEFAQGNIDLARRYAGHGLVVNKRSTALLTLLGLISAKEGSFERAREYMEAAVKVSPRERKIWQMYERIESESGDARKAASVKERSIAAMRFDGGRLSVSAPLPGDFNSVGTWVGSDDLRGQKAETVRETRSIEPGRFTKTDGPFSFMWKSLKKEDTPKKKEGDKKKSS